jgi:hypothetical protein
MKFQKEHVCVDQFARGLTPTHLEETDEGKSWSIHGLWILTIRSDDVAAS